jgi:hypothetical protein
MNEQLDKAFISFRVGVTQWLRSERFGALLDLFAAHAGVTDEITFFTSETHPPLPLEEIRRRCDILSRRMNSARERGYRTGINILATIGHHDENLPHSLQADYVRMTDITGEICRGSFCPNDERFRLEYVRPVYEALASADPDYIWIDDDVRLRGHMPISDTCFCDTCLDLFAAESGLRHSRESLQQALATAELGEQLALRRAWLAHNRRTIGRLLALIETTVHTLRPGMPLGFMDGSRFYEGFDLDTWADILAGPDGAEVMWRPGGGNYTEESLDGVADKAHQLGREAAVLPDSVVSIQSELESFPYQRLRKSSQYTALEAAMYIAAGCTGTAFNVLSMYDEPLDEYEPLVRRLRQTRPFLDLLASTFGRLHPEGLYTGWNKESASVADLDTPAMGHSIPGLSQADEMFKMGLPVAYRSDKGVVTALTGDGVLALEEDEIRRMLAGGVYLDAPALQQLDELGYGDLIGFRVMGRQDVDGSELLLEHPLNGSFVGRHRNGRQSFYKCPAYFLEPLSEAAVPLARLVDYADDEIAPCCAGVCENALGGRVCVAGYYPWEQLQSLPKSSQIKSIFRWLAKDQLGAHISSFHRVAVWDRVLPDGRHAVALVNMYLDPAEEVELTLRTSGNALEVTDMGCATTTVHGTTGEDGCRRFVLPTIAPWHMVLAVEQPTF